MGIDPDPLGIRHAAAGQGSIRRCMFGYVDSSSDPSQRFRLDSAVGAGGPFVMSGSENVPEIAAVVSYKHWFAKSFLQPLPKMITP